MHWHNLPAELIQPDNFYAIIEIPKGSKTKYEVDEHTGVLKLDRILYTSTHYPANYGFIPRTLSQDGDPLDVLVLCTEPLVPLCAVEVYPIGVLIMLDQGARDEKIIAIPHGEPQMNSWKDLSDLPPHMFKEIQHFFSVYKQLEGKHTEIVGYYGVKEAEETVKQCIKNWEERQSQ